MLKERVLIIDNDKIWLSAAVETFEAYGYEAYGAQDTEEAKQQPDCDYALIDLIMPSSPGNWITYTAWLKGQNSSTKCFVISSHERDLLEAEKSGADIILKPLSMEELVEIFEAKIKNSHVIDAAGEWVKRFQKMVDRASQQMDAAVEKVIDKTKGPGHESAHVAPSEICKKSFVCKPDFWLVASLILVIFGGVSGYIIIDENRKTKLEYRQTEIETRVTTIEQEIKENNRMIIEKLTEIQKTLRGN